jgi:hypothetical protein
VGRLGRMLVGQRISERSVGQRIGARLVGQRIGGRLGDRSAPTHRRIDGVSMMLSQVSQDSLRDARLVHPPPAHVRSPLRCLVRVSATLLP